MMPVVYLAVMVFHGGKSDAKLSGSTTVGLLVRM